MEYKKGPPKDPTETITDKQFRKWLYNDIKLYDYPKYVCEQCHRVTHFELIENEEGIEVCEDCYFGKK